MAITLTGGATFVGGANIGTLPEPPPPVPPSEWSTLLDNGPVTVTDEGNGTFFLDASSITVNLGQISYASDVGKTSGKWYYFLQMQSMTVANPQVVMDTSGNLSGKIASFADFGNLTVTDVRVVYVDVDAGTYALDDLSGTELNTGSWTGSGTLYFGVEFYRASPGATPKARISFDPNFASATLRPGYSILAG